jgi:hypothetical protein
LLQPKKILFLIILKLDRTYSSSGNIFENKKEVCHYKGLSSEEIGQVFAYLNSVSFDYPMGAPPKMDKTKFASRKNQCEE